MQNKTMERFMALATALVVISTIAAAILSFTRPSMTATMRDTVDVIVFVVVCTNAVLSLFVFVWVPTHLGALTAPKAYWTATGTTISAMWDLIAFAMFFVAAANPATFAYLGIVLLVDAGIDTFLHFKR